jgi:hypothetical protein
MCFVSFETASCFTGIISLYSVVIYGFDWVVAVADICAIKAS